MQLMISAVEPGDGQALASLYRWLHRDSAVARQGQVTVQAVGRQSGDMSGALDVISVVFADAGAAAGIGSLLVAFRSWRDTRTQAPAFTIEKDGVIVVVNSGSEQEIQQILNAMLPDAVSVGSAETAEEDLRGP